MNTSSNAATEYFPIPANPLMYREVSDQPASVEGTAHADDLSENARLASAQDIENLLQVARAEAATAAEQRLRNECRINSEKEGAKIATAIDLFREERKDYFVRVESEVVHLALAIAAKILHREAQVDTMLVAGLVRVAIDKLHDGSSVSVRVCPASVERWQAYLANLLNNAAVQIQADENMDSLDCILETDLGSANFSIDAQLKEVEQGFFDLLAQRPAIR